MKVQTLPFESTGDWSVKHGLDYQADIVNSRNMDFNSPGYACVARNPVCIYNKDSDSNFKTAMAIVPLSSGTSTTYYLITTGHTYSWDASVSAPTALAAGAPTTSYDSDAVIFNGILHVSGGTVVAGYASSSWTNHITGLSSSYPKPMVALDFQPYLAVANQNVIKTYDVSYSVIATCTLPAENIVTSMRCKNGELYIGTRNIGNGHARLFVWNGSGTVAQSAWDAEADWIYAVVDYGSSVCILTSAGQLLRFDGGGFSEMAHFPVYTSPYSWATNSSLANGVGRCANRGIIAHGNLLYLNIDGRINLPQTNGYVDPPGQYIVDQPSGLWIYDPAVGLYHHAGYKATKFTSSTFTVASSYIVMASSHSLQTGDLVYFSDVGGLTGVNQFQTYYVIAESANTFKLAQSKPAAFNGTALTITGTVTTANIVFSSPFTVGAPFTTTFPGAVGLFITDNPLSVIGGELMYSGVATKTDFTTVDSFMSLGGSHNIGNFVTTPLPAVSALDSFKKLFSFSDNLFRKDDEIVIKYRTNTRYGFPTRYKVYSGSNSAVWTSATTFTIDSTANDMENVAVGDEVDFIEGTAAGYTAHITALDTSSSTYTVTIDETLPASSGNKSSVIFDNWTKLGTITYNSKNIEKNFTESLVNKNASWVQFKVEIRGIDVSVRRMENIVTPYKEQV